MTTILDIPFCCLPFMLLIKLTVLSKECRQRAKEALHFKDRGHELITFFKGVPFNLRESKINLYLSSLDTWYIWMSMASKVFPSTQTSFMFIRPAPCSVDICTTHRNRAFNLEVSTQHSMDMVTPHLLFGNINYLLQPSLVKMVEMWEYIMSILLGATTTSYDEVWWRTSPLTFYEVNLVHNVYYQYADVVIASIDGVASVSLEQRRTRVVPTAVCSHLATIIDFVNIGS